MELKGSQRQAGLILSLTDEEQKQTTEAWEDEVILSTDSEQT